MASEFLQSSLPITISESDSTSRGVILLKNNYSNDKNTKHYLTEENQPGRFKTQAGKSYQENISSLIYVNDIDYFHLDGLCELRLPNLDIHLQTLQEKNYNCTSTLHSNKISVQIFFMAFQILNIHHSLHGLSLIHISSPRDLSTSRMPSSA